MTENLTPLQRMEERRMGRAEYKQILSSAREKVRQKQFKYMTIDESLMWMHSIRMFWRSRWFDVNEGWVEIVIYNWSSKARQQRFLWGVLENLRRLAQEFP